MIRLFAATRTQVESLRAVIVPFLALKCELFADAASRTDAQGCHVTWCISILGFFAIDDDIAARNSRGWW